MPITTEVVTGKNYLYDNDKLKIGIIWRTWERNDITNVLHSRNKQYQAFKSQAKTGVWSRSKTARIQIPPHIFHRNVQFFDTCHQFIIIGFTFRTTYYFAYFREKYIHGTHCFAIFV